MVKEVEIPAPESDEFTPTVLQIISGEAIIADSLPLPLNNEVHEEE